MECTESYFGSDLTIIAQIPELENHILVFDGGNYSLYNSECEDILGLSSLNISELTEEIPSVNLKNLHKYLG